MVIPASRFRRPDMTTSHVDGGAAAAIEVESLRKAFGDTVALDDVSFGVAAGTVLGLLGPNGAGKTTLVSCLATLMRPDGGRATVAGHDLGVDPGAVRTCISLTGQFAALDDVLTGRENLVLFGRLLGLRRPEARSRADELLTRFELLDAADRPVGTYSGGMRRRLDLAVSLVVVRPVLFLDEPTTGLDPRGRRALWDVVRALRSAGTTVLLTTQYLDEADQLADRILVIDRGRLIADGTPDGLKDMVGGSVCSVHVTDEVARGRAATALAAVFPGAVLRGDVITVPAAATAVLVEVVRCLDTAGVEPDDLVLGRPTLDDVFFALTGQPAGDPAGPPAP
jgi:ABC-2 type transport system ATP-binding protein